MHKSGKYKEIESLPTLKTMLLPINDADAYCAKKLIFSNKIPTQGDIFS